MKLCSIGQQGRGHNMGGKIPRAPGRENILEVAGRLTPGEREILQTAASRGQLQELKRIRR